MNIRRNKHKITQIKEKLSQPAKETQLSLSTGTNLIYPEFNIRNISGSPENLIYPEAQRF